MVARIWQISSKSQLFNVSAELEMNSLQIALVNWSTGLLLLVFRWANFNSISWIEVRPNRDHISSACLLFTWARIIRQPISHNWSSLKNPKHSQQQLQLCFCVNPRVDHSECRSSSYSCKFSRRFYTQLSCHSKWTDLNQIPVAKYREPNNSNQNPGFTPRLVWCKIPCCRLRLI